MVLAVSCAPVTAAYRSDPHVFVPAGAPVVRVYVLEDLRPEEDRNGAGAGLFNKSTKDSLYDEPVAVAITKALVDELRARGIDAFIDDAGTRARDTPYELTGAVCAYRAIIVPPRTAFIPYISYVTWVFTHDHLSAGIDLNLTLTGPTGILMNQPYSLSENRDEWVGIVGLASTVRRLDSEMLVKILRTGLKDILTSAAGDIRATVR